MYISVYIYTLLNLYVIGVLLLVNGIGVPEVAKRGTGDVESDEKRFNDQSARGPPAS
jgi:hypothetical protein